MKSTKIAVLCYHSWDLDLQYLEKDIVQLREDGWSAISLDQLISLKKGSWSKKEKFFHITNDDVYPSDEKFAAILRKLDCPATFFVITGLIPKERLAFYQELDKTGLIGIEDHSLYHRKKFIGPRLIEFKSEFSKSTGLEPLNLKKGAPILEFGSELAGPLYKIGEEVDRFCIEKAKNIHMSNPMEIDQEILQPMISEGFAKKINNEIYIPGTHETQGEFQQRLMTNLREGKENFERLFGRSPKAFCYPLFQSTEYLVRSLSTLGYELQFGGGHMYWDGRSAVVPRVALSNDTTRPLDPDKLCRLPVKSLLARQARRIGLGKFVDFMKKAIQ